MLRLKRVSIIEKKFVLICTCCSASLRRMGRSRTVLKMKGRKKMLSEVYRMEVLLAMGWYRIRNPAPVRAPEGWKKFIFLY